MQVEKEFKYNIYNMSKNELDSIEVKVNLITNELKVNSIKMI